MIRNLVPENEIYRSIVEMRVLQETEPLPLSWSQVADRSPFQLEGQTPVRFTSATSRPSGRFVVSARCRPAALQRRHCARPLACSRSEPDQDADGPSDDTSVSILSAPHESCIRSIPPSRRPGLRRSAESAQPDGPERFTSSQGPRQATDQASRLVRRTARRRLAGPSGLQHRRGQGNHRAERAGAASPGARTGLALQVHFRKAGTPHPGVAGHGRPAGRSAVAGDLRIAQRAALVAGQHGAGPWRSATMMIWKPQLCRPFEASASTPMSSRTGCTRWACVGRRRLAFDDCQGCPGESIRGEFRSKGCTGRRGLA